jgi:hypothetical protein
MAERAAVETKISQLETLAQAYRDERYRFQRRKGEAMSKASTLGNGFGCARRHSTGASTPAATSSSGPSSTPPITASESSVPGSRQAISYGLVLLALPEQQRSDAAAASAECALCGCGVEADVTSWLRRPTTWSRIPRRQRKSPGSTSVPGRWKRFYVMRSTVTWCQPFW